MPEKIGAGNQPQPYIDKGNGDISGQYTNKQPQSKEKTKRKKKPYRNIIGKYNPYGSKLVKKVTNTAFVSVGGKLPPTYKPNSVGKIIENGYVVKERYYNEKGEVYLDIDYTNHGNPKTHPHVPHIHIWIKDKEGFHHQGGKEFE